MWGPRKAVERSHRGCVAWARRGDRLRHLLGRAWRRHALLRLRHLHLLRLRHLLGLRHLARLLLRLRHLLLLRCGLALRGRAHARRSGEGCILR